MPTTCAVRPGGGDSLELLSDGSPFLDFVYVGDLAPLLSNLNSRLQGREIILLTSGQGLSIFKLASMVAEEAKDLWGKTLEIRREGKVLSAPKVETNRTYSSCLYEGWQRPLREGIRQTLIDMGNARGRLQ